MTKHSEIGKQFWNDHSAKGKALRAFVESFPKSLMGLTPDYVKAMPEYKRLRAEYDAAFQALRKFNASRFSDPAYLKAERAVNRSQKAIRRNVHNSGSRGFGRAGDHPAATGGNR